MFRGCKSLLKVHPSIEQLSDLCHLDLSECGHLKELPETVAQLTKLGHLDLRGCHSLKRLPASIQQLYNLECFKGLKVLDASYTAIDKLPDSVAHLMELVELILISCKKLRKLPEQFGEMKGLRLFDASCSAIEQLPDSFGHLINLADLQLSNCQNLTSLSNSIWKLKLLKILRLSGSSKLERLPEQLGNMQCLEYLNASSTAIEEVPDSVGMLSRLQLLNLNSCKKLKHLPDSIWNLTSLAYLYLHQEDTIRINQPDTIKYMKLEYLSLRCNIRIWLPVILSFSSLKRLILKDEGQGFASMKSCSLSKLFELQYLTLESLPLLPPHLQSLEAHKCTKLQYLPDLSMLKELTTLSLIQCRYLNFVSLRQSSLQVGRDNYSSFTANLPNREIAEWFSYKSNGRSVSLEIPPDLGDRFLGVALWIVYTCKTTNRFSPYIKAVFKNKTGVIKKSASMHV